MNFAGRCTPILLFLVASLAARASGADEAAATDERAARRFEEEVSPYVFTHTASNVELTRHPRSLLNWSNPARNGEDGAVFVWKADNKPIVIGTAFTFHYRNEFRRKHCFLLLEDWPIRATHRDRTVWTPRASGVERRALTKAPRAAAAPAQLNFQFRTLARRFHVVATHKDGTQERCRLVPQPLYRFDGDDVTGAIFSFSIGTDPEALLMLERHSEDERGPRWTFAFGRFTFYPLDGYLDDERVWSVPGSENLLGDILARPDYQREPYVTFRPERLD